MGVQGVSSWSPAKEIPPYRCRGGCRNGGVRCLRERENALIEKPGGSIVLLPIVLGWVSNNSIDWLSSETAKITMSVIDASW